MYSNPGFHFDAPDQLLRRRRRAGLYQFMAPERHRPGDEVSLNDIVLALKEHTTSTGLPHIHHSRGPIKKGWWIMITLGAIGGLIFNLYNLASSYMSYDVNVAINIEHSSELTFPSITICNLNPIRQSALLSWTEGGQWTTTPPNPAKIRRKRDVTGDGKTTDPASNSQPTDDKCCCSCCFSSSVVANINDYCACNTSVFPYDPSSCPVSSSSSSSRQATTTRWLQPATTTVPKTTAATTATTSNVVTIPQSTTTIKQAETTATTPLSSSSPPITTTKTNLVALTTAEVTSGDDSSDAQEQSLIEFMASLPLRDKVALGFSAEDLILDCKFEGAQCYLSQFASYFNEIHGNCYLFNSGWTNFTRTERSKKTGRRHGLHLILNVDQNEYLSVGDDTAGIRLVVSNQLRMPFPEDEGLALNPGQSTSIGLRQVTMKRLPNPYGNCVDPTQSNIQRNVYEELHPGIQYSTLACIRTCYQSNMISSCGCGDPAFPLTGTAFGLPSSSVKPCSHNNQTQQSCKEIINSRYNQNQLKCDCPDSCSDTEFTTTLSIGQWPSNVQKDDILSQLQNLVSFSLNDSYGYKENLIKVEIFFEDFDYELMEEVPAYLLSKFISDIGGVLGLWLGMSVLTACEFFEFGLDLFIFSIHQFIQYKKEKKEKQQNKGINVRPFDPYEQHQNQHQLQFQQPHFQALSSHQHRPQSAMSVGIGSVNQMEMSEVA